MNKKRTSLEDFVIKNHINDPEILETKKSTSKPRLIHLTAYLKPKIHEQLRTLAFEERRKLHDYIIEGLDKVFAEKGLPSIKELSDQEQ